MGGGRAPARQGALTAAIAATPARFYHSRHLQHIPISGVHAGEHARTCGCGYGHAGVGVGQGGNAEGVQAMRAKARA